MRRLIIGLIAVAIAVAALFIWITQRGTQRKPHAQVAALSSNKVIPARAASPADDGNWTMPGEGLCVDSLQRSEPSSRRRMSASSGRLHLLDRHNRGVRSAALGRQQHDVRGCALAEQCLRA